MPDTPDTVEMPDTPSRVEMPDTPDTVEMPDTPSRVEMPDTPGTVEMPDTPDTPGVVEVTRASEPLAAAEEPASSRPGSIAYTERLVALLDEATTELHRLAAAVQLTPSAHLLGAAAVRSSSFAWGLLEDDRADLLDVLRFEAGDADGLEASARSAAARASDRTAALRAALDLLAGGAALDADLLDVVCNLVDDEGERGRPDAGLPGRTPGRVAQLQRLIHDRSLPLLVRVALAQRRLGAPTRRPGAHRIGPVLAPLALAAAGAMPEPVLRLPCYFAARAARHRELLEAPAPEPWVRFFLEGVRAQAHDSGRWVRTVHQLQQSMQEGLVRQRVSPTTLAAAAHLVARPYVSAGTVSRDLGVSGPTARSAIDALVEHGHLVATSSRRRDRFYAARSVLAEVYGYDLASTDASWSLGGDSNP